MFSNHASGRRSSESLLEYPFQDEGSEDLKVIGEIKCFLTNALFKIDCLNKSLKNTSLDQTTALNNFQTTSSPLSGQVKCKEEPLNNGYDANSEEFSHNSSKPVAPGLEIKKEVLEKTEKNNFIGPIFQEPVHSSEIVKHEAVNHNIPSCSVQDEEKPLAPVQSTFSSTCVDSINLPNIPADNQCEDIKPHRESISKENIDSLVSPNCFGAGEVEEHNSNELGENQETNYNIKGLKRYREEDDGISENGDGGESHREETESEEKSSEDETNAAQNKCAKKDKIAHNKSLNRTKGKRRKSVLSGEEDTGLDELEDSNLKVERGEQPDKHNVKPEKKCKEPEVEDLVTDRIGSLFGSSRLYKVVLYLSSDATYETVIYLLEKHGLTNIVDVVVSKNDFMTTALVAFDDKDEWQKALDLSLMVHDGVVSVLIKEHKEKSVWDGKKGKQNDQTQEKTPKQQKTQKNIEEKKKNKELAEQKKRINYNLNNFPESFEEEMKKLNEEIKAAQRMYNQNVSILPRKQVERLKEGISLSRARRNNFQESMSLPEQYREKALNLDQEIEHYYEIYVNRPFDITPKKEHDWRWRCIRLIGEKRRFIRESRKHSKKDRKKRK